MGFKTLLLAIAANILEQRGLTEEASYARLVLQGVRAGMKKDTKLNQVAAFLEDPESVIDLTAEKESTQDLIDLFLSNQDDL